MVEYLVAAQADPNERMPEHLTDMGKGLIGQMGELYDQGNTDVMVKWCAHFPGSTPLHEAAFKGSFSVVRALCVARADPALTNKRGATPSSIARERGLHHIAEELQVHIDQQAKEKEDSAKQALLRVQPGAKPPLPASAAPAVRAPEKSAWSFWPSSWTSAVCCATTDSEQEVSLLVPMEVPGFAVPSRKASKDLETVSTEAGSDA